jgi:hypothetical protein
MDIEVRLSVSRAQEAFYLIEISIFQVGLHAIRNIHLTGC